MANLMLRISKSENASAVVITLEGRVAGLWVGELLGAWKDIASLIGERKVQLDIRGVTFADGPGKKMLRDIYSQSGAEILARTAWTEHLAFEIRAESTSELS
jgi:hypothetical protein